MANERNISSSRFRRRAMEFIWPFGAFQKTNDPHKAIENLERASGAATLWILGGILIDIALLVVFEHEWAERMIGIVANAAIGFGLIVEYLIVGKVIDATKEAERESNERIAQIEERVAKANERAFEAKLELEKFKAPRQIDLTKFVATLKGLPKAPVEILFVRDDADSFNLAIQIREGLNRAGWAVVGDVKAIDPQDTARRFEGAPSAMTAGGQPSGVTVVMRATSQKEAEREFGGSLSEALKGPFDTPRKALTHALKEVLGSISGSLSGDIGTPGIMRVVVAPKP